MHVLPFDEEDVVVSSLLSSIVVVEPFRFLPLPIAWGMFMLQEEEEPFLTIMPWLMFDIVDFP